MVGWMRVSDTQCLRSLVKGSIETTYFWQVNIDVHKFHLSGASGFNQCTSLRTLCDAFTCTLFSSLTCIIFLQLKKEYSPSVLPSFPPKKIKLFPLTPTELDERRTMIERYIQLCKFPEQKDVHDREMHTTFSLNPKAERILLQLVYYYFY